MLRDDRGFTLIEVIAAFTVFAVVAIPLIQILVQGDQLATRASRNTIAVNIAQQKMEELISQGWVNSGIEGAFETGLEEYWGAVSLSPQLGLMLVTVSVTYGSAENDCSVQFSTLLPQED
mgnify:CR=1 FL=1